MTLGSLFSQAQAPIKKQPSALAAFVWPAYLRIGLAVHVYPAHITILLIP